MRRKLPQPISRRSVVGALATLPALWAEARAGDAPLPAQLFHRDPPPPASAAEVLDVMSFEPLARAALPPAHFGYLATGVDDDRTVARNHDAFAHYEIRSRRFADLDRLDTSCTVFGVRWPSPLYLSAVSGMRAFHPEGEAAVARAARTRATQLMLSTGSSVAPEEVAGARAAPLWQQLYPTDDWRVTEAVVRRAEGAGSTAIALTVDGAAEPRVNETLKRAMLSDNRQCGACHVNNQHDMWRKAPMFAGLDVSGVTRLRPASLTPEYLDRLRRLVRGRLVIKGVVTGEDATLALEHGADALVVSNHGGRNEETLRATIDCLPEVVAAVRGRIPVLIDGGFRRGTDVFKALALGATAAGIGRPQAWGLAAFGQAGVEAVVDILNRELGVIMRQAGTATIADITAARVMRAAG
ncbi:MAG TPA: alpha-hydroxy acid oxidase [Steroidobacteraceae bacterium]|nr:alpha-hydroxy acid oxidase [Steroidobacteraceae bacterium]